MSRIGKMPVAVPKGVDVKVQDGVVTVKGPKGALDMEFHPEMEMAVENGEIRVGRPSDEKRHKALHGLTRSLVANMVEGVTDGFSKNLEIIGVGYKAEKKGSGVILSLGFSHTIDYQPTDGVNIETPTPTTVIVSGTDKQKVGQTAAEIRSFRPPEPYKGKGVRYQGEHVRRKAGKTAGA